MTLSFPHIKKIIFSLILGFLSFQTFSQTPDFNIQHIEDGVHRAGGTTTSFTAVSSLANAVALANNNRKSHAGQSDLDAGKLNGDDMSGARVLTGTNTLTYFRESGSKDNDMRFNTSIWEYVGTSGGVNEMIVRGRYAVALNGNSNNVTQALSGISNANDCIPFITGIMNSATADDADSGTAIAYLENASTLRVLKGSNGNNVTVYITVVEFTGSNWKVHHGDSGTNSQDTGGIPIRSGSNGNTGTTSGVNDWSEAVIFGHHIGDTGASGINDAIADNWPIMDPGSNNHTVDWTFNTNHDAGGNRHFAHVLENSELKVTRFQDTSSYSGESTVNISSAGLSDINQALIVGSSISSGGGNAYARGWRNYYLNSTTEAAHWSHRSGNTMSHEIQIVDFAEMNTTSTGPSYCDSYGDTDYDTGITLVDFNTISNASNIDLNEYSDFTGISTNVQQGSSHDLTVNLNTDGNYTIYAMAWIDWNHDGDFEDAGESYQLGFSDYTNDGPTSLSPLSVTVPLGATIGSTRMRISSKWNYNPTSCETGFDGEVEDYTINVISGESKIDFDGVDDYLDFGDNHDFSSSFSIEAWVLQEQTVANGTIISKGDIKASGKKGYFLTIENNYPHLKWYNSGGVLKVDIMSPYAINNNQWYHIAVTYKGSTSKLFIDGLEVGRDTTSSSPGNRAESCLVGASYNSDTPSVSKNHFNGFIDELRIWNVDLSETQLREMMNQEIEQNGIAVKGKVIPRDISEELLWDDLVGYYNMNDDTADDSSNNNINGAASGGISTSQEQTAPLPYFTNQDGEWGDTSGSTPWKYSNTVWGIPNAIGVDGSTTIDWNIVELNNDVSSGDRNISLLGLISTAGKLEIEGTNNITTGTGTGHSLIISHYLELDGTIDLVGESQLIQTDGSILDADSGGSIEKDQQGTANSYNYNYWSSSVSAIIGDSSTRGTGVSSNNANFTISEVLMDGTDADNPNQNGPIQYSSSHTAADSNTPPTPLILSTYWFYKFYGINEGYSGWSSINENSTLLPGEGYTMKGTSGAADIETGFQNYVFKGQPNNGEITLELDNSSEEVSRLVGNPYPSAIDATEFILDNMSVSNGGRNTSGNIFNGALYFWDHFGAENSHYNSDYVGGYATKNLLTGTAAISNDSRINDNGEIGTKVPRAYIAVNQGFFVGTENDGSINISGGDIIFKNSQRVFQQETSETSVFMRSSTSQTQSSQTTSSEESDTPVIRLMYDSPAGFHRQIAIGKHQNASNNYDFGYDAPMADINTEDMYWMSGEDKFVIQGVNNFGADQEFPLGIIVDESGLATIKIDALENIDEDISLFIKDNETNTYHDLRVSDFEFELPQGIYNTKFSLVFHNQVLALEDEKVLENDVVIFMNNSTSEIQIRNNSEALVEKIALYNSLGQMMNIWKENIYKAEINLPISKLATGVYIVSIETGNGQMSKKIIIE